MGRWAQAARRGGGAVPPVAVDANNLALYESSLDTWVSWSSSFPPDTWEIEQETWSDQWNPYDIATVPGTQYTLDSGYGFGDGGFRARVRGVINGVPGGWSDWVTALWV